LDVPRPSPLEGSFVVLGSRVPRIVGLLVGLTLCSSILGAVGSRNGGGFLEWGALVPGLVLRGELWRVLSFVFFETEPLGLVFACLGLFWFGRDLTQAWGASRFLATYLVAAALTGLLVTALAFAWAPLQAVAFIGPWPLVSAMIVAWAVLHPHRDVLVYFVLPLRGKNLIYATLLGTLLFALLGGVLHFVPHFVAQGLALLYMREPFLGNLWLRLRYRLNTRGWRRRASHLRPVDRVDDEPPKWLH
jgi:membrane associated rhomboid family serine protease